MKSSDSQYSSGTLTDSLPLASGQGSCAKQLAPRGAPMLPSYPMIMTPQGPMPALMMNPSLFMHNATSKTGSAQHSNQGATTASGQQQGTSQNAPAMLQQYMTFAPMQQSGQAAAQLVLSDGKQAGQNKTATAKPTFQMQPQQWGMVPTAMPGGQIMYVMVPMSHARPSQSTANISSPPGSTPQGNGAYMQPMSFQFMPNMRPITCMPTINPAPNSTIPALSNKTQPPAALKASHAPAPDAYRAPVISPVAPPGPSTTPAMRTHTQTSAAQAPTDSVMSRFDERGDADMLRVFLGHEEEANAAWSPPQDDDKLDVDTLFGAFDDSREEISFDDDLNFSSCTWDQLEPSSDVLPSQDFSADSLRTVVPLYAEDDSSGSGGSGHGFGNFSQPHSKRNTNHLDSIPCLKPLKAGVMKKTSSCAAPLDAESIKADIDALFNDP